jgi:hypothetical protein
MQFTMIMSGGIFLGHSRLCKCLSLSVFMQHNVKAVFYRSGGKTGKVCPRGSQEVTGKKYSSTVFLPFPLGGGRGRVVNATPHCIGGWVGPRAGLDVCENSRPLRGSISGPSSLQQVAAPTTQCFQGKSC